MKVKGIGAAIIFTLMFLFGFSQVNLGVKVGYGVGNVKIESNDFNQLIRGENIQGYEVGTFVNFQWDRFYIRPELLFQYKEGKVQGGQASELEINRFAVPVIAGIRILGPLWIEGGPTYHHTFSINSSFNQNIDVQRSGIGYRIGPNLQLGRLNIFVNYEGLAYTTGDGQNRLDEPFRINGGIGIVLGDF